MSRDESVVFSELNATILAYYMVVHSLLEQTKRHWTLQEVIQLVNCKFRCPKVSERPDNEVWIEIISESIFQAQNIRVSTMIDSNGQRTEMFSLENKEKAIEEIEKSKERLKSYERPYEERCTMFTKVHHMFMKPPFNDITDLIQAAMEADNEIKPNTTLNQRSQDDNRCEEKEGQDLRRENTHNPQLPASRQGQTMMSSPLRNPAPGSVQQPQCGCPFPCLYPQNPYPHPSAVYMQHHAPYGVYPPSYDHWRPEPRPESRDSQISQERRGRRDRRTEEDYCVRRERDRRRRSSSTVRTRHHSRRREMERRRRGRCRSRSRSDERYRHRSRSRSDERQHNAGSTPFPIREK